jgi:V/A-type H+-transporting ATPase subunit C
MILDRAMFAQMLAMAEGSESEFLMGYIRLSVDLSNLRVVTRAANANKGYDYLRRAVSPGGTIAPDRLYSEVTPDSVIQIFSAKDLLAPPLRRSGPFGRQYGPLWTWPVTMP